jgi:methionyl-tRNA formyltransferase
MLANDAETGVTIMQVVPALDAGAMLKKAVVPITENDTAQTLHDTLSDAGGRLMVEALEELDTLAAEPQDEALVTYAAKLQKSEAPIDWAQDASRLARQVRAFNPFPVAQATMRGEPWRLWFARAVEGRGEPGEIIRLEGGIVVACGHGALSIETLQRPGGKQLNWKDFMAGVSFKCGDRFDA